ncbi:MAG TPA: prepilin-type N-terminal cleavage/methylation domain-containing protein [Geobacteraceae bacterium]|nr:prepilin-type N-terminal cleavage/methylation domain-containing protein [Geobacteraceae bacterium]
MMKPEKSHLKRQAKAAVVSDNRGFTLIELLVVCVILGILASFAIPAYTATVNKARVSRCEEEIRGLERDIAAYQADRGVLPDDLNTIGRGSLLDPWGHNYVYYNIARGGGTQYKDFVPANMNSDYDLYSLGADNDTTKKLTDAASQDDIIRGNNGAFVGLGTAY